MRCSRSTRSTTFAFFGKIRASASWQSFELGSRILDAVNRNVRVGSHDPRDVVCDAAGQRRRVGVRLDGVSPGMQLGAGAS
jgi:hypothetical protein